MAKQPFDHIEDRFRQAAENISFPPNEKAWEKMEELLDKRKRRRGFFFWLFTVLFGVLGGLGLTNLLFNDRSLSSTPPPVADERGTVRDNDPAGAGRTPQNAVDLFHKKEPHSPQDSADRTISPTPNTPASNQEKLPKQIPGNIFNQKEWVKTGKPDSAPSNANRYGRGRKERRKQSTNIPSSTLSKSVRDRVRKTADEQMITASADPVNSDRVITDTLTREVATGQQDTAAIVSPQPAAADTASSAKVKISKPSSKWSLSRGFNFSFATRFDATALHHIDLTKFQQLFGGTIGYRFSDHLSIQTGLFFQKSVYFAGPEDYYVKPGSYLSYYRISKIDAVCSIYDIPLSVRYDVVTGKNTRLFVNAGMSSFFLKSEKYRYHATGSSGYRMFDSTYTSNRNFFASGYFSVGMERKLTRSLALQAEPYVRIPVSGIGAGRVKLYSAGMQVSVRFQPQKKEKSSNK